MRSRQVDGGGVDGAVGRDGRSGTVLPHERGGQAGEAGGGSSAPRIREVGDDQ
jgi:hypothetical protein